jgi:hypothetical protein
MTRPRCEMCRDPKESLAWRGQMIRNDRIVLDYITDDVTSPTGFNCHTHGIAEHGICQDLQIVYPHPYAECRSIFLAAIRKLRKQVKFEAGKDYHGILRGGFRVRMVEAREGGRWVLRLIIPGKDDEVDCARMKHPFHMQYDF